MGFLFDLNSLLDIRIIPNVFRSKNGSMRYTFILLAYNKTYFVKIELKGKTCYTVFWSFLSTIYICVEFGGIHMGTM